VISDAGTYERREHWRGGERQRNREFHHARDAIINNSRINNRSGRVLIQSVISAPMKPRKSNLCAKISIQKEREGKSRNGCEVSPRRDLQSNPSSSGKKTGKTERNVESLIPGGADSARGMTDPRNRIKSGINIRFPASTSRANR